MIKYYRCNICFGEAFKWESDEVPNKCLNCGTEGKVGEQFIEVAPLRIVFSDDDGNNIFLHKSGVYGRNEFRVMKDYRYLAEKQFKLIKEEEKGWFIESMENVVNPAFLNEVKLEPGIKVILDQGKVNHLFIGNITIGAGIKLIISFE